MRIQIVQFIAAAGLVCLFGACKKDKAGESDPVTPPQEPVLKVYVNPTFGSDQLFIDSTYTTDAGYRVQFTRISFFATSWANGSKTLIDAAMYDFGEKGALLAAVNGDAADFTALQGNIGVDAGRNHDDPSAFPNSSPLNILNAGSMHWDWNPGYIFIALEGKADTTGTQSGPFDVSFTYHVGLDENLETIDWQNVTWQHVSSKEARLDLTLDMKIVIDAPGNGVDLKTETFTHSAAGQEMITDKIRNNFKNALHQ